MRLAIVEGKRREASPGLSGCCPGCGGPMRAKCGEVLTWHWAHLTADCDPWSEPESQWHLNWKARFPEAYQEVVIGPHRADVKGPAAVLEVQKSQIAPEMIREREEFYGEMLWMLNGEDFAERFHVVYEGRGTYRFEWKNPRKTWATAERRILIDFGEIFEITRIDTTKTPWTGRGRYVVGVELYEAVCGKGEGLVDHQWYLNNAALHAVRRASEDRFDAQAEAQRLANERFWVLREAAEDRILEDRIAEDLEIKRKKDEAWRKLDEARRESAEYYYRCMAERRESEARQKRLQKAADRALQMLDGVQWYALEQRRGQIYIDILKRRPYAIQDVGHWSTPDLLSLLLTLERRNITSAFCEEVARAQREHP